MNLLRHETSPYLKQHADNPVHWLPWSATALDQARDHDKPVFLSIGYSACHWCHVMAHESFENEEVARILNEHYICIKMDREEYPDLDHYYMMATSILAGRGGWPNSVWLLPDGRPWYAGTYFPREDRDGQTGFKTLLIGLADLWRKQRASVEEQATNLAHAMAEQQNFEEPDPDMLAWNAATWSRHVQQHYQQIFDSRWGGFGAAPKFPPHIGLNLLLTSLEHAPNPVVEIMIQATLDAMAFGGIHDHIGGGFHRYATDEKWFLPHFEKMLYDNALLLKAYARAAVVFKRSDYHRIARSIFTWLTREMIHPDGAFFAALDADSEGEEGRFYTWTMEELETLLDPPMLKNFCQAYQIEMGGNVHDEATGRATGRNLPVPGHAKGIDPDLLEQARHHLLAARQRRPHPGLDDKIITSWNGLMISALAVGGRLLKEPVLVMAAQRARAFVARHLTHDSRLARCWTDGRPSAHEGRLEDYAALILADLDLFEVTSQTEHLESANNLMDQMLELFFDESCGQLFMASATDAPAGIRVKDRFDQGSPSGTGLAVQAMIRLALALDDEELLNDGLQAAAYNCGIARHAPSTVAALLEGLLLAGDALDVGDSGVHFTLTPETMTFDKTGKATATLSLKLPDNWHLNEVYSKQKGNPCALTFKWKDPAPPLQLEARSIQKNHWRLSLQKKEQNQPLLGLFTLGITCQICSEDTCLPTETFEVPVKLG